MERAEAAYLGGATIKPVAKDIGIGHERLARLLRERGIQLRRRSPSIEEPEGMRRLYTTGASLERIRALGYSTSTIRNGLLADGSCDA